MGKCTKGENCLFAHEKTDLRPLPDLTCTKLCKALIQTGVCTVPDCKYAHNKEELRSTSTFHKTKMCRFALMGHCALGDKCNFAHSPSEIRELDDDELEDEDLEEWRQAEAMMMMNLQQQQQQQQNAQSNNMMNGQSQGLVGIGNNNGTRGRPGAAHWLGGLMPNAYNVAANSQVAVPYRTLGDPGAQGLLAGQGNVFMLGMPAVATTLPEVDFNTDVPTDSLQANADLARRRGGNKAKESGQKAFGGEGWPGARQQQRPFGADALKEVPIQEAQKKQTNGRGISAIHPGAGVKEQPVVSSPLVDVSALSTPAADPIITMGDGDAAAGGRHTENSFRAAPGPAPVLSHSRVPSGSPGFPQDSCPDLAGGVGPVVDNRDGDAASRLSSTAPSDSSVRKYSAGSPSSTGQEASFMDDGGPAYVKTVVNVNGLVVKNTFLDFTPQLKPMRLVRTAEGALCSMGEDDEEG